MTLILLTALAVCSGVFVSKLAQKRRQKQYTEKLNAIKGLLQ